MRGWLFRSRGGRLLLGLLVTVLVLAALEGILRVTMPVVRTATLPDTMIRDHLATPGFRYDADMYWYWASLPSDAMQINRHGFRRTTEMNHDPTPGRTRVIAFGDSQTLGAGVDANQSYSAVAERVLGPDWEVLNAGISGYRTLNIYRLLQRRMGQFKPDIIVIDCMPFDSPKDDGNPVGLPEGPYGWLKALLWRSSTYHLLQLGLEKLRPNRGRWLDQAPPPTAQNLGMGNFDEIIDWGKSHDVAVIFSEYPVSTSDFRISCQTLPGELPQDHPIVPACEALKADGRSGRELFQDRNHLTVAGNEVMGRALADTVRPLKK